MKKFLLATALAGALGMVNQAIAAPVLMNFNTPVQSNNTTITVPGTGTYGAYSGLTYDFLNVATANGDTLDARVTITELTASQLGVPASQYQGDYQGTIPRWETTNTGGAQPNGDLGIQYEVNDYNSQLSNTDGDYFGIIYQIQVFDGTGAASGTFNTPYNVSELSLIIYDVDGEGDLNNNGLLDDGPFRIYQAENLVIGKAGLESYKVGTGSNELTKTGEDASSISFGGDFRNVSETSKSAAVQVNYENVSGVAFALYGRNISNSGNPISFPNPVFTGVDGSLEIIDFSTDPTVEVGNGNPDPTPMSAPNHLALFSLSLLGIGLLRRRRC
ncbi:hypothetical protein KCN56_09215 [Photobacterium galatheae]|uniref:hypothetical protein n=1 Tax=Photobacterium galatheae TaxID=1654360 RepID=UPI00202CBE0C|nr:hypothetical protein [Photobacterium galatheae]MCM0148738.1 hypothetical protein [Photobacterium galatheae]